MKELDRRKRRLQVVFTRKMQERKVFMEDLKEYRSHYRKEAYREIVSIVGPGWYQVLSNIQRQTLDTLHSRIYQDLLQGEPERTLVLTRLLGIYPDPNKIDLLNCMFLGHNDPKEFLAHLYYVLYDQPISNKLPKYCANARLICSAIFYLGLEEMILFLKEKYKPDPPPPPPPPKPKQKKKISGNPYLAQDEVKYKAPVKTKRRIMPPLPKDLGDINSPYEEIPYKPKPPPPPPPPPPPKKRLPKSYCDKLADYKVNSFAAVFAHDNNNQSDSISTRKRTRSIIPTGVAAKKLYGIYSEKEKKKKRRKPKLPRTKNYSDEFLIQGVYRIRGKSYFVIGSVARTGDNGHVLHGGYTMLGDEAVRIHKGIVPYPTPPQQFSCGCLEKYDDKIIDYLQQTKCKCGHFYDFQNDGNFSESEIPYFQKPDRFGGFQFHMDNIFDSPDLDAIKKEMKDFWELDSLLHIDDEETYLRKKKKRREGKKQVTINCLPAHPKIEHYLRCALRLLRATNAAARLPDLHLAPELHEWMRYRLYGPLTDKQKQFYLKRSCRYWSYLRSFEERGLGKIMNHANQFKFKSDATWKDKDKIVADYKKYVLEYKVKMLRSHLHLNNLLWATTYNAKFPDPQFRRIFFAYLVSNLSHLTLFHPYSAVEVKERRLNIMRRPYICIRKNQHNLTL